MPVISAGLLLYRRRLEPKTGDHLLEVLLVHPGGPYWAKKDRGAWSIPKGEAEPDELGPPPATVTAAKARNRAAGVDLLAVALREVREETGLEPEGPFQPLGGVKAHHHKLIFAWAAEHDCDPAAIVSEPFSMEWPPRSGRQASFPEVDRAAWFELTAAREAIGASQRRFLDDLEALIAAATVGAADPVGGADPVGAADAVDAADALDAGASGVADEAAAGSADGAQRAVAGGDDE